MTFGISRDNGRFLPNFGMDYAIFGYERAVAALFVSVFLFFIDEIACYAAELLERIHYDELGDGDCGTVYTVPGHSSDVLRCAEMGDGGNGREAAEYVLQII